MDFGGKHGVAAALNKAVELSVGRLLSGGDPPPIPHLLYLCIERILEGRICTDHPREYVKACFRCLKAFFEVEQSVVDDDGDETLLQRSCKLVARHYAELNPFGRNLFIEQLRFSDIPLSILAEFFSHAERFAAELDTSPPPRELFLSLVYKTDVLRNRPMKSIVYGLGSNRHYNVGIASQAEIVRPRVVAIDDQIIKVSMSTRHSLFLSADGSVYACGRCGDKRCGLPREDLATFPQKVPLPKGVEVVDIATGEGYSLFLTRKALYACGTNTSGLLGLGKESGPFPVTKVNLPPLRELILDEIVVGEKFTLITTTLRGQFLLSGVQFGQFMLKNTFDFYEDFEPEWNDCMKPCQLSFELSSRVSPQQHCGIATGQIANFSWKDHSYSVRFVLYNGLNYRFGRSSQIGQVLFMIDGIPMPLDVAEFNVDDKGRVFLRASLDSGVSRVYSIYTGHVELWHVSDDDPFEVRLKAKQSSAIDLKVIFVLQPVPNTCFASSLCVSADGENVLYVIGRSELQDKGARDWTCLRLLQEPIKEVPFDCKVTIEGRSWSVMSSVLQIRIPNFECFMNKKIFHLEWVFEKVPRAYHVSDKKILLAVAAMIVDFIRAGAVDWSIPGLDIDSTNYAFAVTVLKILGLELDGVGPESGYETRAVVPRVGLAGTASTNCVLECVDEDVDSDENCVEINANRQLLELHSLYFVMAGKYDSKTRFVIRANVDLVRHIVEALATPASLEQRTQHELRKMLSICDRYGMDILIEDIIRALCLNANHFLLSELDMLYQKYFCARDSIVRELLMRPDLVLAWSNSHRLNAELVDSVCAQLDVATIYRCGIIAASPLQNGTAIRLSIAGKFSIPPAEDSDEEEEQEREPVVTHSDWYQDSGAQNLHLLEAEDMRRYMMGKGEADHSVFLSWYRRREVGPLHVAMSRRLESQRLNYDNVDWLQRVVEASVNSGEWDRKQSPTKDDGDRRRRRRTDTRRKSSRRDSERDSFSEDTRKSVCVGSLEMTSDLHTDIGRLDITDEVDEIDVESPFTTANGERNQRKSVELEHGKPVEERIGSDQMQSHNRPIPIRNGDQMQSSSVVSTPSSSVPLTTSPTVRTPIDERAFPELGKSPVEETSHRHKKASTPSGGKQRFRKVDLDDSFVELVVEKVHVAPWAHLTNSPPKQSFATSPVWLAEPSAVEKSATPKQKQTPKQKSETHKSGRQRTISLKSLGQMAQEAPSIPVFAPPETPIRSLQSIMAEEESIRQETMKRRRRPLGFVEMEDRAIEELVQLYGQSHGDAVLVSVCRCEVDVQKPIWQRW